MPCSQADHAGRRRAVLEYDYLGAGDGGVGGVLRRDWGGREQPGAVYAAGRGGAAGSHHGPAGAAGHRRAAGKDVNFTIVGGGATGVELAGALAELRETALDAAFPEVDLANVHITLVEHGARPARAVRPGPAGIRAPGTGQARRGGPPVHRDPGGHPGLRAAGQRRGPAQRRHHLGGGVAAPAAAEPVGAAPGARRPHPDRARPAGPRPGPGVRGG